MRLTFEQFQDSGLLSTGIAVFIACDTCGGKIQGQGAGVVVFETTGAPDRERTGLFQVIHKGKCETPKTRPLPWLDLDLFLRDVLQNSEIDLAVTEQRVAGLRSAGLHK